MNAAFAAYVASAKVLAADRGLKWDLPCDDTGKIAKASRWDLTALVGMIPPPSIYVTDLGVIEGSFERLNEVRRQMGQPELEPAPMSQSWRDLYLAIIIHHLLVRKNKPASAMVPARWIRHLASAARDTQPWAVTPDQVRQAYNAALLAGESGKNALNFEMTVRNELDDQHLADIPALARFCLPLEWEQTREGHQRTRGERSRVGGMFSASRLRSTLSERKSAAKLPEEQAFWEMIRIIFTETPRTFSDVIRFAILKLGVISGLRVGEIVLLPFDCIRWREYVDGDGLPAGSKGGTSRSLMLRHFAEKQVEDETIDGVCLYENAQHVPPMFEELVLETLSTVRELTAPVRERLRLQIETGRLIPEYPPEALVPAHEMFTRMSGSALFSKAEVPAELEARYRKTLDPRVFEDIRAVQLASDAPFQATSVFWLGRRKAGQIAIRNSTGDEIVDGRIEWKRAFLRVGEVEACMRATSPTIHPDLQPATLTNGTSIHPHELMFLLPIRNLIEGRNEGLLDPTRYFAFGRIATRDINRALEDSRSIFRRYGASEQDRQLSLNPHALRHLQTTELFRLGVADTIITKRFNRRSVAQSYEYDHRSLAEDLANIDTPEPAEEALSGNARQVYRLIAANKVSGPIIDEFRRIQRQHGDDVAFEYLNAEADGLHVTPYGFCVNSFAVDPCPKHLECFNGCRHLARSDVDKERENLERLRDRMTGTVKTLEALPEHQRSAGWHNQIAHAQTRLSNILTAIDTRPGEKPFPEGPDLYQSAESRRGTSVLDTVTFLQDGQ
ncbi:hypothetical protein HNQ36_000979 [Afipia massiliensis]|uniref:Uncharacterized protein n=1 Tax=Afipia massiliensis TaxID=211460 RepID=A0A840MTB9_9BRAD|nr:hypothetical protein [Afipia massiliensis]MBB5051025.1 hypothetical protein [Afipia massiliensis]